MAQTIVSFVADVTPHGTIREQVNANAADAQTRLAALEAVTLDDDLQDIAALSPGESNFLQFKSGAWTNRAPSQARVDLAIDNVDNTSDANKPLSTAATTALAGKQASSATLTTLSGKTVPGGTTLADTTSIQTLTNKTMTLGTNTITGTTAQFNTALTDGDFATLAGTETMTNKTLTSPKFNENVAMTATSTELNLLDGATVTTVELNRVGGVTSNIQTQLNAKAPSASPTLTGDIYLNGGQRSKRTPVADTDYTILTTDSVVCVTSLTAPRTLTLPAAATAQAGRFFMIQDETNTAASFPITVEGNGAETINGALNYIININRGGITLYSTGSAWIIPGGG